MRELLGTLLLLAGGGFIVGAVITLAVHFIVGHDAIFVGVVTAAIAVAVELGSEAYERLRKRL